jgi:phage I-like protein
VEKFRTNGLDLPLDWEHASELKAPKGESAPAAGWITALEVRDGGSLWGKIDWTESGSKSICAREYRYVSPGFYHDKTGTIIGLSSAGLTNKPALKLAELAREQEETMNPELLKLLKLDDKATPEQVLAACQELAKKGDALVQHQTEIAAIKAKQAETEQQLATARAAVPGLDKFVPRADYDLALARVKRLEDDNASTKALAHRQEVETEITNAVKAGKVAPASVEIFRKQCESTGGLAIFREFVKTAPTVVSADEVIRNRRPEGSGKVALSSEERKFISRMGLTEDEYRAGAVQSVEDEADAD